MKKLLLTMTAVLMLTACEKETELKCVVNMLRDSVMNSATITFEISGDFEVRTFTRGSLTAEDNTLTDLWMFDFLDGECVSSIHQVSTDQLWGRPQMELSYGSHHIYFVASRGFDYTVNETTNTIIWEKPRDTFWKDYTINVTEASSRNISVRLDRVVTKLKVGILDKIPEGMNKLVITPSVWYTGLNYVTGVVAGNVVNQERSIDIPSSYIGTTGVLFTSIFGFSGTDEWTADLSVEAKNSVNEILGVAHLENVPFKRNRATELNGNLFNKKSSMSLETNDEWDDAYVGEW